jgi:hypothetical protein
VSYEVFSAAHHPGWDAEDCLVSKAHGAAWQRSKRSLLLIAPSAVARMENYVLINDSHPEARRIMTSLHQPIWPQLSGNSEAVQHEHERAVGGARLHHRSWGGSTRGRELGVPDRFGSARRGKWVDVQRFIAELQPGSGDDFEARDMTADIQAIRIVDLIEAGLVSRSERLHGFHGQDRFEARVKRDGTIICGTKVYASPSVAAGEAITSRSGKQHRGGIIFLSTGGDSGR